MDENSWDPGTPASTSIPGDPLNQGTSSNFKPKVLLREVITAPEVANYLVISYPGRPTFHKITASRTFPNNLSLEGESKEP
jgi:hypothetical protein